MQSRPGVVHTSKYRQIEVVAVLILIFIVGTLLGVLLGGALCVRYLRQEVTASIVPRLRLIQLQLDNLESTVNLALMTRYTELSGGHLPNERTRQVSAGPST